jgi:AsmA protein
LLGKGEVHLDVRTVGISEQEINRSLSGTAAFDFKDGAYKGVNLDSLIRGAGGALGGGSGQATGEQARTDFSSLSASAVIKNGLITNNDLDAKSPLLRVSGKGTADLAKSNMDYVLTTELVATLQGQGGKTADKLTGVPIPVRIKGPFNDLSYTPDLSSLLKAQAEKKIKEEIKSKAAEKLQDKLKGGLNLPGLFR